MKDNGKTVIWMVLALTLGSMDAIIAVSTVTIRSGGLAVTTGPMEGSMKVIGIWANSMVSALIAYPMKNQDVVSGRMGKELNGSPLNKYKPSMLRH